MDTRGIGNFENDDAQDLISILNERNLQIGDLIPIIDSVASIVAKEDSDYAPDAYNSRQALVAIELLAALKGKPASNLPIECQKWVESQKGKAVPTDIADVSRKAVEQIKTNSELEELWREAGKYDDWKIILSDLEKRIVA